MIRNGDFLDSPDLPVEVRMQFIESLPIAEYKLGSWRFFLSVDMKCFLSLFFSDLLKKMIKQRFPEERVCFYPVTYVGVDEATGTYKLGGLDAPFAEKVPMSRVVPLSLCIDLKCWLAQRIPVLYVLMLM